MAAVATPLPTTSEPTMLTEPVANAGMSQEHRERYSRQMAVPGFGEQGQQRLAASHVVVVGAGGLGVPVLQYLAGAGVGRFTIIDDDVVSVSNLPRQVFFTPADVGRSKAQLAAAQVRRLNPQVQVVVQQVRLDSATAHDLLAAAQVIIDATDNFDTRYLISDTATGLGIPVVWGAIFQTYGQVSTWGELAADAGAGPGGAAVAAPVEPGDAGAESLPDGHGPPAPAVRLSLRDLYPIPPVGVASCAQAGVLAPLCGQVGTLMASEALRWCAGFGQTLVGRVVLFDAHRGSCHEIALRPARPVVPQRSSTAQVSTVTGDQLQQMLAGHQPPALIDVREPSEFAAGALPGARNIPLAQLLQSVATLPSEPVVLYCHSGARAHQAGAALAGAGHPHVHLYPAGWQEWAQRTATP